MHAAAMTVTLVSYPGGGGAGFPGLGLGNPEPPLTLGNDLF
jgi:hypothetical protein